MKLVMELTADETLRQILTNIRDAREAFLSDSDSFAQLLDEGEELIQRAAERYKIVIPPLESLYDEKEGRQCLLGSIPLQSLQ